MKFLQFNTLTLRPTKLALAAGQIGTVRRGLSCLWGQLLPGYHEGFAVLLSSGFITSPLLRETESKMASIFFVEKVISLFLINTARHLLTVHQKTRLRFSEQIKRDA